MFRKASHSFSGGCISELVVLPPRSPVLLWFEGPPGLELDVICDHSHNGGLFGLGWPETPGNIGHLQNGRILVRHALRDLKPLLCSREVPAR
jgi:hypothetical protein